MAATELLSSRPPPYALRSRNERTSIATCSVRDRETITRQNKSLTISRSTPRLTQAGSKPITEKVLQIAGKMDDPKARDLKFLLEDAKLLHQKLTALNTEGVDLKKVGLFSNEVLQNIEASAKRPKTVYTHKGNSLVSRESRNSVDYHLAKSNGSANRSLSPYYSTMSLNEDAKKSKSLKRAFLGAFTRHKHVSESSIAKSRSLPRYNSQDEHQLTHKVLSLSRPNSPKRKKSSSSFRRSSSLDFLDHNPEPSDETPVSTPSGSPPLAPRRGSRLGRSFTGFSFKRSKDKSSRSKSSPKLPQPLKLQGDVAHSMPSSPLSKPKFRKTSSHPGEGERGESESFDEFLTTPRSISHRHSRSSPIPVPLSKGSPPEYFKTPPTPMTPTVPRVTPKAIPSVLQRSSSAGIPGKPPRADMRVTRSVTPLRTSNHSSASPSPQSASVSNLAVNGFRESGV